MTEQTPTVDGLPELPSSEYRYSWRDSRFVGSQDDGVDLFIADQMREYARAALAAAPVQAVPKGVLTAEAPRRWRWVDCTPHEGYFDHRSDGEWVMWSDVAHLFGVALAALPDVETELRKLPELDADDVDALMAMVKAGHEYAAELRKRMAKRGKKPVCPYTDKVCQYEGNACACTLPNHQGKHPTRWVAAGAAPTVEALQARREYIRNSLYADNIPADLPNDIDRRFEMVEELDQKIVAVLARSGAAGVQPPEFQEATWGVDSVMRPCKSMAVSEFAFRQWAEANGIALAAHAQRPGGNE